MKRTKISGLVMMAIGVPLIGLPAERATTVEWLAAASPREMAIVVALVFAGANLLAGGLITLLTGLQGLSLAQPRIRAGALKKLAGANLLIPCFGFAASGDAGLLDRATSNPWIAVPALIAFVIVARLGIVSLRTGWKYEARSAADVRRTDPRPPVLYLRSFRDDAQIILTTSDSLFQRALAGANYTAAISPEQELAMIMGRVGPVIAIGKPGEPLPELGAAREYVADDQWQGTIDGYLREARLVVIRAGTTDSLWWEIERALQQATARHVVIVSLGVASRTAAFDERFAARFGTPRLAEVDDDPAPEWLMRLVRIAMPIGRAMGRVICFDAQRMPFEMPIRFRLSLTGLVLAPYRPYRDALAATMRQVFRMMDLEWRRQPTQTTAVLLALFGGMIGAHHFYLGRPRRAWWYVLFAVSGVPVILGWIEGIRMALVDRHIFDRDVVSGRVAAPAPAHAGSASSASHRPS